MSVNGVNAEGGYSTVKETKITQTKETKTAQTKETQTKEPANKDAKLDHTNQNTEAVVYTKSDSTVNSKRDTSTIERMKAEAEQKTAQLRSLVEKMMTKQGLTYNNSTDIFSLLREGKLQVDPEVATKAKEDIAQDGYWGVEQTSERLVTFAKALAGNDPNKADELMNAIEDGYKEATKSWGDELPEICKKTLEATREKMKAWKEETSKVEE